MPRDWRYRNLRRRFADENLRKKNKKEPADVLVETPPKRTGIDPRRVSLVVKNALEPPLLIARRDMVPCAEVELFYCLTFYLGPGIHYMKEAVTDQMFAERSRRHWEERWARFPSRLVIDGDLDLEERSREEPAEEKAALEQDTREGGPASVRPGSVYTYEGRRWTRII